MDTSAWPEAGIEPRRRSPRLSRSMHLSPTDLPRFTTLNVIMVRSARGHGSRPGNLMSARSAIGLVALALACASCSSPVPHADHTPRHGGVVMMYGDLHYEVVLNPQGEHRVYFSDAQRAELPASVTPEVTIAVTHEEGESELLQAEIDPSGAF